MAGAYNAFLMNQDALNMTFLGHKGSREVEEDQSARKRCRFISDEAEEVNSVVDSDSKEDKKDSRIKNCFLLTMSSIGALENQQLCLWVLFP